MLLRAAAALLMNHARASYSYIGVTSKAIYRTGRLGGGSGNKVLRTERYGAHRGTESPASGVIARHHPIRKRAYAQRASAERREIKCRRACPESMPCLTNV